MKRTVCLGLALGIVVALTATLGFRVGTGTTRRPSPPVAVQESNHAYVVPSSVSASSQPSPIPAVTGDAAPTVSLFVKGWLSTEPKRRRALIEATCSPRLAELLLLSDPAKLPDARPVGLPTSVRRGLGVESYAQGLSDGTSIAVDLAADPGRVSGWAVMSVRPGNF